MNLSSKEIDILISLANAEAIYSYDLEDLWALYQYGLIDRRRNVTKRGFELVGIVETIQKTICPSKVPSIKIDNDKLSKQWAKHALDTIMNPTYSLAPNSTRAITSGKWFKD